jgi:hypothetical protein
MAKRLTKRRIQTLRRLATEASDIGYELDKVASILKATTGWRGYPDPHPDEAEYTRQALRLVRYQVACTKNLVRIFSRTGVL